MDRVGPLKRWALKKEDVVKEVFLEEFLGFGWFFFGSLDGFWCFVEVFVDACWMVIGWFFMGWLIPNKAT